MENIGKIIPLTEARNLFGEVIISKGVPVNIVSEIILKCKNYFLCNILDNELYILDSKRNILFAEGNKNVSEVVFHIYSINKLSELLEKEKTDIILFEKRKDVFSITSGEFTLEYNLPCPPFCYD